MVGAVSPLMGGKRPKGNLYTPTEGLKWCKKVQEAKVAKAWYDQLLVAGELPEKTKGMRPPEVLKWEVYRRV